MKTKSSFTSIQLGHLVQDPEKVVGDSGVYPWVTLGKELKIHPKNSSENIFEISKCDFPLTFPGASVSAGDHSDLSPGAARIVLEEKENFKICSYDTFPLKISLRR